jgi:hypothetical protein
MRTVLLMLVAPACLCLPPSTARADFERPRPGEIALRDMPGSGRRWQEARTIVPAPPEAVRRWLTQFEYWPGRFRDVTMVRVLRRHGNATRLSMRSKIMERELVLDATTDERGVFYQANDGDVHAVGRIFITATGDGKTDVIMQSSARVTGVLGVIAPASLVRQRERAKLSSDLQDLGRLAERSTVASEAP